MYFDIASAAGPRQQNGARAPGGIASQSCFTQMEYKYLRSPGPGQLHQFSLFCTDVTSSAINAGLRFHFRNEYDVVCNSCALFNQKLK
jgi:hypothetical protein